MALCRQVLKAPGLVRQCSRVLASTQPNRGYADMPFSFASPTQIYYDQQNVKQVDVPGFSSTFGILPNHVPTISVLQPGVVTVFEEDKKQKYFVSSGTVTVNKDSTVQVLAEEAYPLDSFDPKAVSEGLSNAENELRSASTEKAKAEAQIAVSCYQAISKALGSA